MPAGIHAGGLRYHGMSAIISSLCHQGIVEPVAYTQNVCFAAPELFAKTEGIVPAPESSHAVRAAIDEAIKAKDDNAEKTILFCLSGHGFFDLTSYEDYMDHKLADVELPDRDLRSALAASEV